MQEGLKNCPIWGNRKVLLRAILFLFFISGITGLAADTLSWGSKGQRFQTVSREGVVITSASSGEESITLERNSYPLTAEKLIESLYISFDRGGFKSPNGETIRGDYKTVSFDDSIRESGSFEHPMHQLLVAPAEHLFLNNYVNTGSFSVYFRVRPYQLRRRMDLFQKLAFFEGIKQGIACFWEGGKLTFEFYSFFWDQQKGAVEYSHVESRDPFQANRFYSVLLQYRQSDGSVTLYIDGVEQQKIYMTSDGTPGGTILIPKFHRWDRSPLVIGRNFLGALDDIIFSNDLLDPAVVSGKFHQLSKQGAIYFQKPGVITSRIVELPNSSTVISSIVPRVVEPAGTAVRLYYRVSDRPFKETLSEQRFPFVPFYQGEKVDLRGRYIQWRAELFANADGTAAPVIEEVSIVYQKNLPPQPPSEISVVMVDERSVTLEFMRSLEVDVVNGGRYHVYYGIKPYEPLGVIRYKSFSVDSSGQMRGITINDNDLWSTVDQRFQNRIKITVDNQMIIDNLTYSRKNPRLIYDYPLIQKNIPLYFWVTVCDNAWDEPAEYNDHESAPSEYVVVRPR